MQTKSTKARKRKTRHSSKTNGYGSSAYKTESKDIYRKMVWQEGALAKARTVLKASSDRVAILPSDGGEEIDHAVAAGIDPAQIIACDHKRKIFRAPWRKRYPQIRVFFCDIGDLPAKASAEGLNIVAANLDLCAAIGDEVRQSVQRFWEGIKSKAGFVLGISLVKARGSGEANAELEDYFDHVRMNIRFRWLLDKTGISPRMDNMRVLASGEYYSNLPMTWTVLEHRAA